MGILRMSYQFFYGILLRGGNSLAQQNPDELIQACTPFRGIFPAFCEQVLGNGQGYIFHIHTYYVRKGTLLPGKMQVQIGQMELFLGVLLIGKKTTFVPSPPS